ncbi:MAG: hypothetical protein L0Y43_05155 [Methylococcaceae bacterium]|nr:hypothetical protein [Methylococcaceae bacterium]
MQCFVQKVIMIWCGLVAAIGMVQGQSIVAPLTFELSGTVQEISPDRNQINIDGLVLNIGGGAVVHNLVNSNPVAPLKAGSEVGYVTNQLPGGTVEIVELWVLSSP